MGMKGSVCINHPQKKPQCVSRETKQKIRIRHIIAPAACKIGVFSDKFCFVYIPTSCLSTYVRSPITGRDVSNLEFEKTPGEGSIYY